MFPFVPRLARFRSGTRLLHASAIPRQAIKHVVMFRFQPEASSEQIQEIQKSLLDLPNQISEIREYELGVDLELPAGQTHPLGKNRTVAWSATFDTIQDYQNYDTSEAHMEFLGKLRPLVDPTSRAAIQYYLKDEDS